MCRRFLEHFSIVRRDRWLLKGAFTWLSLIRCRRTERERNSIARVMLILFARFNESACMSFAVSLSSSTVTIGAFWYRSSMERRVAREYDSEKNWWEDQSELETIVPAVLLFEGFEDQLWEDWNCWINSFEAKVKLFCWRAKRAAPIRSDVQFELIDEDGSRGDEYSQRHASNRKASSYSECWTLVDCREALNSTLERYAEQVRTSDWVTTAVRDSNEDNSSIEGILQVDSHSLHSGTVQLLDWWLLVLLTTRHVHRRCEFELNLVSIEEQHSRTRDQIFDDQIGYESVWLDRLIVAYRRLETPFNVSTVANMSKASMSQPHAMLRPSSSPVAWEFGIFLIATFKPSKSRFSKQLIALQREKQCMHG